MKDREFMGFFERNLKKNQRKIKIYNHTRYQIYCYLSKEKIDPLLTGIETMIKTKEYGGALGIDTAITFMKDKITTRCIIQANQGKKMNVKKSMHLNIILEKSVGDIVKDNDKDIDFVYNTNNFRLYDVFNDKVDEHEKIHIHDDSIPTDHLSKRTLINFLEQQLIDIKEQKLRSEANESKINDIIVELKGHERFNIINNN
jgi:hypothetical protein